MKFFENRKIEKNLESRLNNPKGSLEDKMDALSNYLIYLRKNNEKKESEVFLGLIKKFKENENKGMFSSQNITINKQTLFLVDKKNNRCLLNNEFCKVMNSFSQIQMTIFANTLENIQPYLDIFVNNNIKGLTLRIDFKNILSQKNIDLELYLKTIQKEEKNINTKIKEFLSNKNIFILNNCFENENILFSQVDAKIFYDSIPFMTEKVYPILYKQENETILEYKTPREIERLINENTKYIPYYQYLEYFKNINIKIDNSIITIPESLLKRNSNFYINNNY